MLQQNYFNVYKRCCKTKSNSIKKHNERKRDTTPTAARHSLFPSVFIFHGDLHRIYFFWRNKPVWKGPFFSRSIKRTQSKDEEESYVRGQYLIEKPIKNSWDEKQVQRDKSESRQKEIRKVASLQSPVANKDRFLLT